MKLTKLELQLLMSIPSTFDNLYAKMLVENVGTDQRRMDIRNYADKLREG